MNTTALKLMFIVLLLGCHDQTTELVSMSPQEQWKMFNIHNYSMEQTRSCFCIYGGEKMKVTVLADTIYSVLRVRDSVVIQSTRFPYYLTIDSLFGLIEYSQADSMTVTYDSKYGFPDMIDIDPQLHPVDGGILYETGNLKPIH